MARRGQVLVPPPRPDGADNANAYWHTIRCPECGHHRRRLCALRAIQAMEEITIPHGHSGNIGWAAEHPGTIISFDGGAREVQGHQVAAGAAILWELDDSGTWTPHRTET